MRVLGLMFRMRVFSCRVSDLGKMWLPHPITIQIMVYAEGVTAGASKVSGIVLRLVSVILC